MAEYFNSLNDALEVKLRTIAVNDKITYAAEVLPASLRKIFGV
jgi:hypothetical protein